MVHEILAAQEPAPDKFRIVWRRLLGPNAVVLLVPVRHGFSAPDAVRDHHIAAGVELLRVEALPPFTLAVCPGERAGVVTDARERAFAVVAVGRLEPMPSVRRMIADAETQAVSAGDFRPGAHDVFFGADVDGVPRVVAGVVAIEIVVVIGKRDEVFRAGADVKPHQFLRLPTFGPPEMVDLHEPGLRRVAVGFEMMFVLGMALEIHLPRIPVALLGHALGRPMRPDAELRVPKPFRAAVIFGKRIPGRLERTGHGRAAGFAAQAGARRQQGRSQGGAGGQRTLLHELTPRQGRFHNVRGKMPLSLARWKRTATSGAFSPAIIGPQFSTARAGGCHPTPRRSSAHNCPARQHIVLGRCPSNGTFPPGC